METKFLAPRQIFLLRLNGENQVERLKRRSAGQNSENRLRRGKLEITAEILLFCDQLKSKTNIMYKTNLNYVQLKKQLNDLTQQGLLLRVDGKYTTSEKGYQFLSLFEGLCDLVE